MALGGTDDVLAGVRRSTGTALAPERSPECMLACGTLAGVRGRARKRQSRGVPRRGAERSGSEVVESVPVGALVAYKGRTLVPRVVAVDACGRGHGQGRRLDAQLFALVVIKHHVAMES